MADVRSSLVVALTVGGLVACGTGEPAPVAALAEPVLDGSFAAGDRAVVALTTDQGNVICTGTLISSKVVLTAGHCSYGFTPYYAYFGRFTPFTPGDLVRVERAIAHPDYDPTDFRHADVGVVVLRTRAPAEPREWNAAPLGDDIVGRDIRIVGFGFQQPEGEPDRRIGEKMAVYLPIQNLVLDHEYEYMNGTCNGDSGGPQFFGFPDGVERVIGVTSYGRGGCTGTSGAHRVDPYDGWLRAQIAAFDPPSCELDDRCVSGCGGVDPDCPCAAADGACSVLCADPASDPECPPGCGGGDVCASGCPAPDPDCGDPCLAEGHCMQDCVVRDPDCPAVRALDAPCSSSFDCTAGAACLTRSPGEASLCTPMCDPAAPACAADLECRRVTTEVSACLPDLPDLRGYRAPGCALVPGGRARHGLLGLLAVMGLLLGAHRSRRRTR